MEESFPWESLTGIGTLILAAVTYLTVRLLKKEAMHQTEELKNQTEALNAQAKALQISAEQFVTAEHLRMGRWLADNPRLLIQMERPEDEYSFEGENAAGPLSFFMDQILRHSEIMGLGNGELWLPYFRDKLIEYPQVRNMINSNPHRYSQQRLKDLAKEVSDEIATKTASQPV